MGKAGRKKALKNAQSKPHQSSNPTLAIDQVDKDSESVNPYSHQQSVDVLSISEQPIEMTNGAASSIHEENIPTSHSDYLPGGGPCDKRPQECAYSDFDQQLS